MILHGVILEAVGTHLVAAFTHAYLVASILCDRTMVGACMAIGQALRELSPRLVKRSRAGTTLRCDHDTGGPVREANGILVLVPVLTAGAGPRVPLDAQVALVDEDVGRLPIENSNGHRARVNTSSPFRGWYSLNAVAAALVVQA